MAEHDDLMAAALDAVNAVVAQHSKASTEDSQAEKDDSVDENLSNALESDSNEASVNAEGLAKDDLDFNLSLSSFDAILNEAANCVASDISLSNIAEPPQVVSAPSEPAIDPEILKSLEEKIASLTAALDEANAKTAELQTENEQLRAVQKQFNDRLVRVSADFDNYRKRVTRDQELMRNQAEERIVTGFLPVMDNLDRALTHARQSDDYQQLLQGVEMTGKLYLSALAKHGCVPFDSLGAEVDPVYHDVLQRVIDPEKPHNTIVQEHLKGYMMHDRVIRPALVVVAQHEDEQGGGEA